MPAENSTLKTPGPKRAERARQRAQEEVQRAAKQIVQRTVKKTDQLVKKMSFLNFQKNKSMTQARKEGKEAVGSLQA